MKQEMQLIKEQQVLGKQFKIYGTPEDPMFLAKDVAEWIEHSNVSKMLNAIDEEEKTTITLSYNGNMTTNQLFLTEDGFYEVLMQSRKPIAKQFKKEVKVILKSIRKTGGYLSPAVDFTNPDNIMKILENWKTDRKKLIEANKRIELDEPKVDFYKQVTGSDTTIDMGKVAKVLNMGIGRNKLFQLLRDEKILQKNNMPYQTFIDRGYFRVIESKYSKPDGSINIGLKTVVYQKGLIFIKKTIQKLDINNIIS